MRQDFAQNVTGEDSHGFQPEPAPSIFKFNNFNLRQPATLADSRAARGQPLAAHSNVCGIDVPPGQQPLPETASVKAV
jgi:hypothetical protein